MEEVLALVELHPQQGSLVGIPGEFGLSVEQVGAVLLARNWLGGVGSAGA